MKYFFALTIVMLLASCGTATQNTNQNAESAAQQEIASFSDDLPEVPDENMDEASQEDTENIEEEAILSETEGDSQVETTKAQAEIATPSEVSLPESAAELAPTGPIVVELSTTYNNPKMKVEMDISMDVSADNIIETISVTSSNYKGMSKFNDALQETIGMSVSDATNFYVSGSSLATAAFHSALKDM